MEAGEANVSRSGLDRLAEALGATFVGLVSAPAASTHRIDAVAWRSAAPESEAILLNNAPDPSEVQLWSWTLAASERYDTEPDSAGWPRWSWSAEGMLCTERDEGPITLAPGDYAVYAGAQTYAYVNVHDGVTRFTRRVVP